MAWLRPLVPPPSAALPPLADPKALVCAMAKAHRRLADDLRTRAVDPRVKPSLQNAHASDCAQGRTGEPYEIYREAFCDQVAASWVLCAVFARTLEDRGYLPHRLAGPGASDRFAQFRAQFKFLRERDYLLHIIDAIALLPGGYEVFGQRHAPLWRLAPTSRAVRELLDDLRVMDRGVLRFSFGRPTGDEHDGASTRYLGDLYQDLNESVRKRYALLQTPEFVERFLLENTLDPAIRERGIAVTVLDPACGSGHLLLGAYDRLFEMRRRLEPGISTEQSARTALRQVYGIDLNPYAAAVARFRLLLSYLDKAGIPRLDQVPEALGIHVHVGDSLLAGREVQATFGDDLARRGETPYAPGFDRGPMLSFFDPETDKLLLTTRFDVIVTNPPYITEKDATKRDLIRERYIAASGQFALSAPFVERSFQLGNNGAFTGQIIANSFIKREFGKRLIEEVLPNLDVTEILDTSGSYIPGHGTPTVILFGRARRPVSSHIRVVMGIRGEPTTPEVPAEGKVWSSIVSHHGRVDHKDDYISVADVDRNKLGHHPWSLGGGGAAELKDLLEEQAVKRLSDVIESSGFGAISGEDNVFLLPIGVARRAGIAKEHVRPLAKGEDMRDWAIGAQDEMIWPCSAVGDRLAESDIHDILAFLWPYRRSLMERKAFGVLIKERGIPWWSIREVYKSRFCTPLTIGFAFVSTHNHFVLDRSGRVFNRTAPIMKLPKDATEEEHLALLGYLNSSTVCFWMKQMCTKKGEGGGTRVAGGFSIMGTEEWKNNFEFGSTTLLGIPVPRIESLIPWTSAIVEQAERASESTPTRALPLLVLRSDSAAALLESLASARRTYERNRNLACALQEEIDWLVYGLMGLPVPKCDATPAQMSELTPACRPVEIAVAERMRRGEATEWYERFRRAPCGIEDVRFLHPTHVDMIRKRLKCINESRQLKLLERLEYKRRWEPLDWDEAIRAACESWLLNRAEAALHDCPEPRAFSVRALAGALHTDPKVGDVAEVLTGTSTYDLESILGDLLVKESVVAAKCQRYTEQGLETRALWERTWELQRLEDAGQNINIPVPRKYDQKDFENAATVWRLRGSLDVPKERFIAYPTATPPPGASGKAGLVFGWAGWTHLEQLQAAIELWQEELGLRSHELIPREERKEREEMLGAARSDDGLRLDAAARQKLLPILQTMVELLPWVKQWHDEDGETATAFEAYVAEQARRLEVSFDEVRAYRRPARTSGRAGKAATPAEEPSAPTDEAALDAAVEAVRALDQGTGVPLAELGARLGLSASALKKTIDALVEAGRLVERKKRPRLVSPA